MSQLPTDCLNDIFEYLKGDIVTLHSCLLVNRLWCEASVRILWRDIRRYNSWTYSTLITCLPNESKEVLRKNGIIISTPTSKPPMFNYATFCKVLSINDVHYRIRKLLKTILCQNINNTSIVAQEIFKMLMNHITSLNSLAFRKYQNVTFTFYPGAKDCLKNLSE